MNSVSIVKDFVVWNSQVEISLSVSYSILNQLVGKSHCPFC
jgi:hypothetical protein